MKSVMVLVLAGSVLLWHRMQCSGEWRMGEMGIGISNIEATGCIQSDTQFANDLGGNLLCVIPSHEEWMFITEYALSESRGFSYWCSWAGNNWRLLGMGHGRRLDCGILGPCEFIMP